MSWNRMSHDACAYNKYLTQSVDPLGYHLDPIQFENCNKCRMEIGTLGGPNVSHIKGNMVDLENDLRGQTRPSTKCPSYKHQPNATNVIQRYEQYKPVRHDPINTTLKHLPPCQMIGYKSVPLTPPIKSSACYIPRKQHNASRY